MQDGYVPVGSLTKNYQGVHRGFADGPGEREGPTEWNDLK